MISIKRIENNFIIALFSFIFIFAIGVIDYLTGG